MAVTLDEQRLERTDHSERSNRLSSEKADRFPHAGIVLFLGAGIFWPLLPAELRYGLGVTCWRHLMDW